MNDFTKINNDLNLLLLKVIDIEKEILNINNEKNNIELEGLELKLSYLKSQISILESKIDFTLLESSETILEEPKVIPVEEPKVSKIKESKETINNTKVDNKPLVTNSSKNSKLFENEIYSFIKDNLLLLTFASFIFIGLVWLFVYISSLSNFSNEIRVAGGFIVSLLFIGVSYVKKIENSNIKVILSLTGYIIGLLVLLFGTIYLSVIPQYLAILISIVYIVYGLYQTICFKSELHNIVIILSSLLLTFAYYYVEAPIEILFAYIIILVISFTFILKKQNFVVSSIILFVSSFLTSFPLLVMNTDAINNNFEKVYSNKIDNLITAFKESEEYSDYSYYDDISYSDVKYLLDYYYLDEKDEAYNLYAELKETYSNYLYNDCFIDLIIPLILLSVLIYSLYTLRNTLNKNNLIFNSILGSFYLFEFSYVMFVFNLDSAYFTIGKLHLLLMLILFAIGLISTLYFKIYKDSDFLGLSYVTLFTGLICSLLVLNSIYSNNKDTIILLSVLLSFIILITGLYQSIFNLKIMGIIYSFVNLNIVYLNFDGYLKPDGYSFDFVILLIYVIGSGIISYLYYKYYNKYLNNSLDKILYSKYNLFTQVYSLTFIISISYLIADLSSTLYIISDVYFHIYSLFIIPFMLIIYFVLRINNKETKYNYLLPYLISWIAIIINAITYGFTLPSNFYFDEEYDKVSIFMSLIELIIFISYIIFLYAVVYYKKNISFIFIEDFIKKNKNELTFFYIRTSLNLYVMLLTFTLLGVIIGFITKNVNVDIINYCIVGFSIIYILYDISLVNKIKNTVNSISNNIVIYLYLLLGMYLFVLVFILLADMSFILRGLIFLAIGIYGLFTNLKNKKNTSNKIEIESSNNDIEDN